MANVGEFSKWFQALPASIELFREEFGFFTPVEKFPFKIKRICLVRFKYEFDQFKSWCTEEWVDAETFDILKSTLKTEYEIIETKTVIAIDKEVYND